MYLARLVILPMRLLTFVSLVCIIFSGCKKKSEVPETSVRSINGFSQWRTGHDDSTVQLFPVAGNDPLITHRDTTYALVRFKVKEYGEVSFPIDPGSPAGGEPNKADLSLAKFIVITYRANQEVQLQLRQTGVHGGVHNHVKLPATRVFQTDTLYLSEFKGGKSELDLSNVSKFNFALLSNHAQDGYAELLVKRFQLDTPIKKQ